MRGRGQLSHFSGEGCASPHVWMRNSRLRGGRTGPCPELGGRGGIEAGCAAVVQGPAHCLRSLGEGQGASEHRRPFQLLQVGDRLGQGEGAPSSLQRLLHSVLFPAAASTNL